MGEDVFGDLARTLVVCILPLTIMTGVWLHASLRALRSRVAREEAQAECMRIEAQHTRGLTVVMAGEMAARSVLEFVRTGLLEQEDREALVTEGRRIAALIAPTASYAQLDAAVRAGLTRERNQPAVRTIKPVERGLS